MGVHAKHESPTSNGSKVLVNVKVFRYVGQRSQSRPQGRKFGMNRKASSQGMHMSNMKALPLMVQKLWERLKVFIEMQVKSHGQGHNANGLGAI